MTHDLVCITLENATGMAAFSSFGTVIDAVGKTPELINDGSTQRFSDIASLNLRGEPADGDPKLSLYIAAARILPLRVFRLERHHRASQVFLPLNNQRFIVVVAPGTDAPDWQRVQAFLTAPGQGICLYRNCWHHGLIALNDGDRFAVIEGGSYRMDTQELAVPDGVVLRVLRPATL